MLIAFTVILGIHLLILLIVAFILSRTGLEKVNLSESNDRQVAEYLRDLGE